MAFISRPLLVRSILVGILLHIRLLASDIIIYKSTTQHSNMQYNEHTQKKKRHHQPQSLPFSHLGFSLSLSLLPPPPPPASVHHRRWKRIPLEACQDDLRTLTWKRGPECFHLEEQQRIMMSPGSGGGATASETRQWSDAKRVVSFLVACCCPFATAAPQAQVRRS